MASALHCLPSAVYLRTQDPSCTPSMSAPDMKSAGKLPTCDGLRLSPARSSTRNRSLSAGRNSSRQSLRSHGVAYASTDDKVKLQIRVPIEVQFGERVAVSGSLKGFGRWKKPQEMQWSEQGWILETTAKPGEEAEFKFLILGTDGGGGTAWENGDNRKIVVPNEAGKFFQAEAQWDNPHSQLTWQVLNEEWTAEPEPAHNESDSHDQSAPSEGPDDAETDFSAKWQGRQASFMRSNEHSGERREKWNTDGLKGAVLELVEGDKRAGNWWMKLEVVRELLAKSSDGDKLDALVFSAIYLQWINTGQIVCVEGGGHHRPNKHAEIARQIFRQLEQSKDLSRPHQARELLVERKIHPRLPAFTAEFTATVPLTRIRDIAHRNDIPHDLKQEIKHTIQNKLHRNAGPEDLIATEAMLKRVSKNPGEYNGDFVEQMRIFYGELKDFFNAASLTDQLAALRGSFDDAATSALDTFLEAKKRADGTGSSIQSLIGALHALTGLRAVVLAGLSTGLRNDASDESIAMRQKWRLAEVGLEDYSFVLLSRFVNAVDAAGGASTLASEATAGSADSWSHSLGATVLGLRQLGLSGWQPQECAAVENELKAWQEAGLPKGASPDNVRMWALRLKASLDRARRIAETYTQALLDLYPSSAQTLGNALGIPENTVRTYAEAEIRASVVFQLAKLCSLLLKAVRQVAGGEGWDALMPGVALGKLVVVDRIKPGAMPKEVEQEAVVLLVKEADGDEEVKAAGANVAGVILCQELPHLSHLGVRARQEGVVFVTCEDEDRIADVRALAGRAIRLEATPESVTVGAYDGAVPQAKELVTAGVGAAMEAAVGGGSSGGKRGGGGGSRNLKVKSSAGGVILQLADADTSTTGAKAAACGELARIAGNGAGAGNGKPGGAAFRVPAGVAIPFGAMEEALKASGAFNRFQTLLGQTESAPLEGGKLDAVCDEIRTLVAAQRLPEKAMNAIKSSLPGDKKLIVRSSANVEDLAGMSGAGLYDSIPNVRLSEPQQFSKAVAKVWASLYTRRAVLSRRVAGVPQGEATMAILVQELLTPDVSFILHTRSPIDGDVNVVQAELALGLGETLASGTRGSPWRLAATKGGGAVKTLAFANFSEALVVGREGKADGMMKKEVVDYSKVELSVRPEAREELGRQLARVGQLLEEKLGGAQDVEGAVVGGEVYIVQSRPQP